MFHDSHVMVRGVHVAASFVAVAAVVFVAPSLWRCILTTSDSKTCATHFCFISASFLLRFVYAFPSSTEKIDAQSSRHQTPPNLRCNKLKAMLNSILMLTILTSKPLNSFVLDSPFSNHSRISTSHNRQQIHLPQTPFWFVVILSGPSTSETSFQYRVCLLQHSLSLLSSWSSHSSTIASPASFSCASSRSV